MRRILKGIIITVLAIELSMSGGCAAIKLDQKLQSNFSVDSYWAKKNQKGKTDIHATTQDKDEEDKIGRALLGILGLLLLLYVVVALEAGEEEKPETHKTHSFVCSNWIDSNNDGFTDADEFVDVGKKDFRRGETVTFVLSTSDTPIGAEIEMILFPPGYEKSNISYKTHTLYKDNIQRYGFAVGVDLIDRYGVGQYHVQWYVNRNLVSRDDITVRR